MPQRKSYFALQLPKGWWVFGLDLALHGDIDVYQFNFFSELVKEKVVIIVVVSCLILFNIQFFFPLMRVCFVSFHFRLGRMME